jgi:hypothetical protein
MLKMPTPFQDIAAMGRLTGVPHFFTEDAYQEEKLDITNLRRARKEQAEEYEGDSEGDDDDNGNPVKLCQNRIAQRMQKQFSGRVIRRTIDSKDWNGEQLLKLPPYRAIHAILDLTERETAVIAAKADEVMDE